MLCRCWAGHVCHLSAFQHSPDDRAVEPIPVLMGLWPDMESTNPAVCVGAVGWPRFSQKGVEKTFCEPTSPPSFSKYRSNVQGQNLGSPGRGMSFRCGTKASQPSDTHGERSATATSLKWSPAWGPLVLRGLWAELAGEGGLSVKDPVGRGSAPAAAWPLWWLRRQQSQACGPSPQGNQSCFLYPPPTCPLSLRAQ